MTYENLTNFRKVFVKYLTISQQRMNEIKKYTDDGKEQDALDDHDMARLYPDDLIGTVMLAVIIYRAVNGLACLQLFQVLDQKVSLKRVRMIVIHLNALIKGNTVLAAVIIVMIKHHHIVPKIFLDPVSKGRFS